MRAAIRARCCRDHVRIDGWINMLTASSFARCVWIVASCLPVLAACSHGGGVKASSPTSHLDGLKSVKIDGPIELRLKADPKQIERVAYHHRSRSTSYEDVEVRKQTEETLDFTSQTETLKSEPNRFVQSVTVTKKEGKAKLHDFAMPEIGERLEITADSRGRILRAGDYPSNSIFYVSPISLPDGPVRVGDTWSMQAFWLSLEEMVPYRLDMTSILKNVWSCGEHRCAELEIAGEVTLNGSLVQLMAFKSLWKGFLIFDIDAGTVLWSRVDSEEQFMSGNVRRSVTSCLEATLIEPVAWKLPPRSQAPCQTLAAPGDIAPAPVPVR